MNSKSNVSFVFLLLVMFTKQHSLCFVLTNEKYSTWYMKKNFYASDFPSLSGGGSGPGLRAWVKGN
jgi:hypothetical protein